MPPNAPSNSRLPQLAIWSGYGTDSCAPTTHLTQALKFLEYLLIENIKSEYEIKHVEIKQN